MQKIEYFISYAYLQTIIINIKHFVSATVAFVARIDASYTRSRSFARRYSSRAAVARAAPHILAFPLETQSQQVQGKRDYFL